MNDQFEPGRTETVAEGISVNEKSLGQKPPIELTRLFGQTWNPEIIISTFAVIILLQFLPYVDHFLSQLFSDFGYLSDNTRLWKFGLISPFYIILLFFIAHILLRSYWLGLIGFHYAYPEINKASLDNEPQYGKKNEKSSLNEVQDKELITTKLDKICSSIFSWAFVAIFIFSGLVSSLLFFKLLWVFIHLILIRPISVWLLMIYIFVLVNYGMFGKNKSPYSKTLTILIMFPLFFFPHKYKYWINQIIEMIFDSIFSILAFLFEVITLQFIYRSFKNRIIFIFGERYFRLLYTKAFLVSMFVIFIQMLLFRDFTDDPYSLNYKVFNPDKYENIRDNKFTYSTISLNTDVVTDFLKVKIPLNVSVKFQLTKNEKNQSELLNSFIGSIKLKINDNLLFNPKPYIYHEISFGIGSYVFFNIDVSCLPKGLNHLFVSYPTLINSFNEISNPSNLKTEEIPFWVK